MAKNLINLFCLVMKLKWTSSSWKPISFSSRKTFLFRCFMRSRDFRSKSLDLTERICSFEANSEMGYDSENLAIKTTRTRKAKRWKGESGGMGREQERVPFAQGGVSYPCHSLLVHTFLQAPMFEQAVEATKQEKAQFFFSISIPQRNSKISGSWVEVNRSLFIHMYVPTSNIDR